MNKNIKQVLDKVAPAGCDDDNLPLAYMLIGETQVSKFAEALINECAVLCENNNIAFGLLHSDAMKRHFGL